MRSAKSFTSLLGLLLLTLPVFGQLENVEAHYKRLANQGDTGTTIRFVPADSNLVADYGQLAQIVLLRHGEPAIHKEGYRNREGAVKYNRQYDSVGIYPPTFIPLVLAEGEVSVIHTSNLPRAMSTARHVFGDEAVLQPSPLYREFERRIFDFPNIRMRLKWWTQGSRILWILGANSGGIETYREAKARARHAASTLEQDALQHGKTVLVAHGLLNHCLVKYLKKSGWTEVYDGGNGYLAQRVLVRYGKE